MVQRLWMRVVVVLSAILCSGAMSGCRPSQTGETEEVLPELKLQEVKFRVWRGTELRVDGEAAEVVLRRDSSELAARELEAVLPRGEPVRITAPEGEGVLAERVFEAHGGVTVERGEEVARTDRARYSPLPDGGARVTGDRAIEVDGPRFRLEGTGFVLDPATGELDVQGPARVVTGAPAEAR